MTNFYPFEVSKFEVILANILARLITGRNLIFGIFEDFSTVILASGNLLTSPNLGGLTHLERLHEKILTKPHPTKAGYLPNVIKIKINFILWLPHFTGLPHLLGVPHLHVNRPLVRDQITSKTENPIISGTTTENAHESKSVKIHVFLYTVWYYISLVSNIVTINFPEY